eukprot:CAMPEP_0201920696 /NCGR_PEP_ID=MMETSP0903-20130614/9235_1 /ASSEMBLY_ACC=CAM_ASM_000552 /TAXON_ID=420261 /ORGANISM="Thalassiosira antarctica, Strain CCMP982" /LENGTH=531 /DNA_ID=CAMNT_0048457497 /DNA_START=53 /DNA_END=1648 /DNA_ORIENTATION=+
MRLSTVLIFAAYASAENLSDSSKPGGQLKNGGLRHSVDRKLGIFDSSAKAAKTKSTKAFKSAKSAKATKLFTKTAKADGVGLNNEDQNEAASAAVSAAAANNPKVANNPNTCVLPELTDDMAGMPIWIQHGQVMTFFVQSGTAPQAPPRKTYTDERLTIANNDMYVLQCQENGYVPDETCFYACKDGVIDTTTYCRQDPADLCKKTRETTAFQQCLLDFDSDEPFHDGKSLKTWWGEVLDVFHFGRDEIFKFDNNTIDFFLGHGAANIAGTGWLSQHQEIIAPDDEQFFDASFVKFAGWADEGDYEYGPDTLRNSSSSATQNGYLQDVVTEDYPDVRFPEVDMVLPKVVAPVPGFKPKFSSAVLLSEYDPCDESKYLGFAPECFTHHHGGFHTGSGEQLPYYAPMINGNIDLNGHCTSAETNPFILVEALKANQANIGEDVMKKAGGITGVHPVVRSVHLCIDGDDIYHPYICAIHSDHLGSDTLPISASPFMFQPTKNRKKLCADRVAAGPNLCKATTDTNYPFPWTQHF